VKDLQVEVLNLKNIIIFNEKTSFWKVAFHLRIRIRNMMEVI
jgi:hypothetical protein